MSVQQATHREEFKVASHRGRLEAGLPPLEFEFYGQGWQVCRASDPDGHMPAAIIPDPGDGSAAPLALAIADLLNSGAVPNAPLPQAIADQLRSIYARRPC